MPETAVSALIAALGAAVLAAVTYWLAKKREGDAELRRERLAHYKEFVASLSGIMAGEGTPEGNRVFARACNNLNLVAPQRVLRAMQAFQDETRATNTNPSRVRHDLLLSQLLLEMRKDLRVRPKDVQENFQVGLWASGAGPADV